MNKVAKTVLAAGLALAVATPALAEVKFNGFYRMMAYSGDYKNTAKKENDSRTMIDQRFRGQITNTLNDNVSIVYQAEIDTVWGENDKTAYASAATTSGGKLETDGVNVETKHLYLDLKYGDSAARLGLQQYADPFQGLIVFADMAGATYNQKLGNTSFGLVYAKWDENDGAGDAVITGTRSDWDDTDFYGVTISQKLSDTFKAGAAVYFVDANDITDFGTGGSTVGGGLHGLTPVPAALAGDDQADAELWFYGVNAEAKLGDFTLDGFVVYQTGDVGYSKPGVADVDTQAWLASAKATMKLSNGNVALRGLYISDDDDDQDHNYWQGSFGEYDLAAENQMFFLTDRYICNWGKERYALNDAANAGYGLWAAILSGSHNLPSNMYANWSLGYYSAVSDERNDEANASREGKSLGYEAVVRVGKKFFEKVDVSVNAGFVDFGSFYDDTAEGGTEDPDSIYKTYLMVNVPF